MKGKELWLATDLDNTLIHSHRHRREGDRCVEWLEGREQSFMTETSIRLLAALRPHLTLLAVTTRSLEQYRRIQWPEGCIPDLAITANGGFLLEEGGENPTWTEEMRCLCAPYHKELEDKYLQFQEYSDTYRCRIVDDFFLFLCAVEEISLECVAKEFIKETLLSVETNGRKLYFFPPPLNKGKALERVKERFAPKKILAAGDSSIDLPMLREADLAFLPKGWVWPMEEPSHILRQPRNSTVFSDWFLSRISRMEELIPEKANSMQDFPGGVSNISS